MSPFTLSWYVGLIYCLLCADIMQALSVSTAEMATRLAARNQSCSELRSWMERRPNM